ncbi:Crp/Fnr family transcriptional regulator [Tenacibaculum sp. 1B UA]|uniref:Crp/Fnr family transcriptional regulator n=1 Tax=unclassified Tenacibaculum TaxID=2635139 RepID=UPI0026E2CDE0|nr:MULTISPECIES: Crp/Fnr family transcriptional regulator [unclassified Tenacibaculum]MDO6675017.1 Crp/Fnr family transcriptional regulator [Tenacibaculum sp. 1_MG-2023]MDX8554428.1 Crp/Fnr family transcriptional regulator [Tenacibaculum sp. 1B UA]
MRNSLENYLTEGDLLTPKEIKDSLSFFKTKQLKKNDFFVRAGEVCNYIAFINKGAVKTFSLGDESITCFKFENQFMTSYESFMTRTLSHKNIQAIENCDLQLISYKNFKQLLERIPSWKALMNGQLEQEYLEKEHYLMHFNNKTAKAKYIQLLEANPKLISRTKLDDLASYLGMTQRTLTRVKKDIFQETN